MKQFKMTLLAFAFVATLFSCSKSGTSDPLPENQTMVDLTLPGTLAKTLSAVEKSTITSLALKGTIDARDFKTMRDSMPVLAKIDLSKASIVIYTGANGTRDELTTYNANTIPGNAFFGLQANSTNVGDLAAGTTTPLSTGKKTLISIIFPSNLTEIGIMAFLDCTGLTGHLIIPESVTKIDNSAFEGCSGINELTLPSSLLSIEEHAFTACSGITGSLNIPTSVTFIGQFAFQNCSGFTGSLILPATLQDIEYGAFVWCSGFTGELNIPSSLDVINKATFYGCSGFTSLIIPASITEISQEAFSGCNQLTSIKVLGSTPATITSIGQLSPFYNINTSSCIVKVPTGSKSAYSKAAQWSEFIKIVEY